VVRLRDIQVVVLRLFIPVVALRRLPMQRLAGRLDARLRAAVDILAAAVGIREVAAVAGRIRLRAPATLHPVDIRFRKAAMVEVATTSSGLMS
jgi:hypothetical protein